MEKVVVIGGSGFVGQQVLSQLLEKQTYEIVSLSKHGQPLKIAQTLEEVKWISADLFHDTNWRSYVEEADYVIDLVGILFEKPRKQITYQKYIVESAQIITRVTELTAVRRIIFLSATAGIPIIGRGYIHAKRQAETEFQQSETPVTIVRSSLIYGTSKKYSTIQALPLIVANKIPLVKKLFSNFKPVKVEHVAKIIVDSIHDQGKNVFRRTDKAVKNV